MAAVGAIWQMRAHVAAERRLAAFAHIRQVATILHGAREFDPRQMKQAVLDFYSGSADFLSDGAKQYLGFLDALDILGLAYKANSVDRSIISDYMAGLVKDPYSVSGSFITEFRRVARDPTLHQHLEGLVNALRSTS